MEDMNNSSHSMGVGQPHHPTNHTRPFFYVQPPTQPYYNMYQWNMNPYGQYGLPPPVIPYGRPYMAPYLYTGMQYPGYVVPQAPMQPVDYSRVFNPHISSATYDVQYRHHYQQQACVLRETACSEVQTDPSDTVHKLIDSLDRLRTNEKPPEDSELNPKSDLGLNPKSDLGSLTSETTTSSSGNMEEFSGTGRELELRPLPQRQPQQGKRRQRDSPLPSSVFSDSAITAVVYHAETSQSCLEEMATQDCWSLGSVVLPIDSSSVHEESLEESRQQCHSEKSHLNTEEPGMEGQSREHPNAPEDVKCDSVALTQSLELNGASHDHHSLDCLAPEQDCDKVLIPSASELKDPVENVASKAESSDLPYRILRLPCDQVTGILLDDPLWYVDSAASSLVPPPQSHLSPLGSAYYCSYYPQVAQERQSVLSPSIDELSSRDELFSTDIEDVDLISGGHMYVGGGKLAEATCNTPDLSVKENVPTQSNPVEGFAACSKTCLSCGLSLAEELRPDDSQGLCRYVEREETDDDVLEEDDYNEGGELLSACQVPVKKPHHPNGVPQPPACQFHNSKPKRGCCEDHHEVMCHEEQEHGYLWSFDCCEDHKATGKADEYKGKGGRRNAPCRPYNEKPWRVGTVASDQDSWGSSGAKYKPKSWRSYNGSQEQRRPPRRRPFVQQRPRRTDYDDHEESDFSRCQRGRGTTKRRGTRY